MAKTAILIGAGPAGLTAASELLRRTDVNPIVLEKSQYIGGISRTVNYKGNRIDIGGHRFFSKSDRVMQWWLDVMPVEKSAAGEAQLGYRGKRRTMSAGSDGPDARDQDRVMLVRARKSRIYFLRKFFEYPLKLTLDTLRGLGLWRTLRIGASYARSAVQQIRPERTLEDFLINRFGRVLYRTFFQSYTEKVWGVPCHQISAEWGAQRIKGLSLTKAVAHHVARMFRPQGDLRQKETETSLIEQFLYPKHGPGQLWECVADDVVAQGGQIHKGWTVERVHVEGRRITAITASNERGVRHRVAADYFFSTMPVKELIAALDCDVPANVREVAEGLMYRDFITVGLLLDRMLVGGENGERLLADNWIYIQEPDVLVGRLQIFNNWSPYMVSDPDKVWVGLEYFVNDTDDLWHMSDEDIIQIAIAEMVKLQMAARADVRDATVIRMEKTYPAYFGSYSRFDEIRQYLDGFENLFLVGRNGMHKYNNQDHSMLTAMIAVDNIAAGITAKDNLWAVNTEMEYHEEKTPAGSTGADLGRLAAAVGKSVEPARVEQKVERR